MLWLVSLRMGTYELKGHMGLMIYLFYFFCLYECFVTKCFTSHSFARKYLLFSIYFFCLLNDFLNFSNSLSLRSVSRGLMVLTEYNCWAFLGQVSECDASSVKSCVASSCLRLCSDFSSCWQLWLQLVNLERYCTEIILGGWIHMHICVGRSLIRSLPKLAHKYLSHRSKLET